MHGIHLADTLLHHHYKDLYVTASNYLYIKAVGENMAHWHLISSNKLFVQQIMGVIQTVVYREGWRYNVRVMDV